MARRPDDSAHGGSLSMKSSGSADPIKELNTVGLKAEAVPAPSFRTDIGKGTWVMAGYHLATTIATPAAYAYLPFAFANLGWPGGMVLLVMGIAVTWYTSILISSLHEFNGVRYVRYRDLGRAIGGKWCAYTIVACQQIASLGNNITLGIVAGTSMKALNLSFDPESSITLQEWIIIFGAIQLVLSQFPTIHDLRMINVASTICTAGFAVTVTALSIYNGKNPTPVEDPDTGDMITPDVSYNVANGRSEANIVFGVFSALGTIAFAFGDTLLPEIQATLGEPVKRNMYRAVNMCYFIIASSYILTAVTGYWAYGNAVAPYLVASFAGPTWAVRLANFFALFQFLGCYQIYCRPTYEVVEVWAMDTSQSATSLRNCMGRLVVTTGYVVILTFIGCLFPFFGDFLALTGAIGFTPLDFMLPLVLWLWVNNKCSTLRRSIHYVLISIYTGVMVLGSIGALRFIVTNVVNYSVFANL